MEAVVYFAFTQTFRQNTQINDTHPRRIRLALDLSLWAAVAHHAGSPWHPRTVVQPRARGWVGPQPVARRHGGGVVLCEPRLQLGHLGWHAGSEVVALARVGAEVKELRR